MNRKEELQEILKKASKKQAKLVDIIIDDVIFLEEQLSYLRTLPFIIVHPTDKTKQKKTEAAKQYKDLSQSYDNKIKILCSLLNDDSKDKNSPLREYLKKLKDDYE